jgi:uncharacterized protein
MKRLLIISFIIVYSLTAFGQVNKTDNFFKTQYYDNGDINRIAQHIDSSKKTIVTNYYRGNVIKTVSIKDSLWCSIDSFCTYYKNRQLSFKLNRDHNYRLFGVYLTYYQNGQIKTSGHYYNDYLTGRWLEFYPNGDTSVYGNYCLTKLDSLMTSIDSTNICFDTLFIYPPETYPAVDNEYADLYFKYVYGRACPKKNGLWRYYNEQGIITKKEFYKNGVLIKIE